MPCIKALIMKPRLRGVWHMVRMDDASLSKMVIFSDLATFARSIGHPLKRFKDGLKQKTELNPIIGWETLTADPSAPRMAVHKGVKGFLKSGCKTLTRHLGWPSSSCAKAEISVWIFANLMLFFIVVPLRLSAGFRRFCYSYFRKATKLLGAEIRI